MYLGSQLDSLHDEKSWGSDSYSSSSSLFKVQKNWTSYGNFSSFDYKDYYQFSSGVGDFTLYVTGDSTNGFTESTPNYLFSIKMLDSSGKDIGIAASSYDTYTKSISYTAPSDQIYYLEIDNTIGSSFSYAATLQASYSESTPLTLSDSPTAGNDLLFGTNDNDYLRGGFGTDTMYGGLGDDSYYVNENSIIIENSNGGTDGVLVNATKTTGFTSNLTEDTSYYKLPSNVENSWCWGSNLFVGDGNELNNDMTNFGAGTVKFSGFGGDDGLTGGNGNDTLNGGAGNDILSGGSNGEDLIFGDDGNDFLNGSINGNSQLHGGDGNDIIGGGVGKDQLFGDAGNDKLMGGLSGDSSDTLDGGLGDDTLGGGEGNDKLFGSEGNDQLIGQLGRDTLSGGAGTDIFGFISIGESGIAAETRDTIADFKSKESDRIHLSNIDANIKVAGDQAFKFIGNKSFSKDATAELRFDSKTHILYGSTNTDSNSEFSIQLNGVKSLVAGDFVL